MGVKWYLFCVVINFVVFWLAFFETETCCVAQIGFDSLIFLLNLPSAGITGVHHHPWQEETFIVFA